MKRGGLENVDHQYKYRLWRSLKCEDVYLKFYENGWGLETGHRANASRATSIFERAADPVRTARQNATHCGLD